MDFSISSFDHKLLTGVLAVVGEKLGNLVTNLTLGNLDIVLERTIFVHEGEETVVGDVELQMSKSELSLLLLRSICASATYKLEFAARDVGNIHVVGGGRKIFKLLAGEDVNGSQVNLGVTVLSSLGGGHVDNLAGTVLDDNETVLTESGTLHGVSGGSTGIGAVEGVLML